MVSEIVIVIGMHTIELSKAFHSVMQLLCNTTEIVLL